MDNVVLGGVATYLERAEDANVNLFILIHSKKYPSISSIRQCWDILLKKRLYEVQC